MLHFCTPPRPRDFGLIRIHAYGLCGIVICNISPPFVLLLLLVLLLMMEHRCYCDLLILKIMTWTRMLMQAMTMMKVEDG